MSNKFTVELFNIIRHEELADCMQESGGISVNFFVVRVSCVVSCPVESTIVIPDGKNVRVSKGQRLSLIPNFIQ